MANSGFGPQLGRRRKWIAGVVAGALTATVLTIVSAYWWSTTRKNKPSGVPQTLPANIHQQLSGYSFTRSDEGRRIFTIHAARTVAFKPEAATVLEDVFVEVFGRSGDRHDILRTQRCDYNPRSGDLFSPGTVEIELNAQAGVLPGAGVRGRQPVYLETSQVSFIQQGSLVQSDAPVRFRIGSASGSARGISYATKDGLLELKRYVALEMRAQNEADAHPPLRLSASRLRYAKESGEVTLWGPVEATQGNRRVIADRGTIFLDVQNRVSRGVLEGNVRAFESSAGSRMEGEAQRLKGDFDPESGQLRTLVAEGDVRVQSRRRDSVRRLVANQLELAFMGRRPRPRTGNASGNVQLTLDSPAGADTNPAVAVSLPRERKKLMAEQVVFTFRTGGESLRDAQTVGAGKLEMARDDPKVAERVITAGQFLMTFDPESRLETLRGLSGTRIVFQPPKQAAPGRVPQESSSERLDATFDPATQALRTLEQVGNFQFLEGDRQASAQQARYSSATQIITLTGRPQVWDSNTRIRAQSIRLDLGADAAEGWGKVQSTHLESQGQAGAGPRGGPTSVVADRMLALRRSQFVHYEGHVRAWNGPDVVECSSLDVYRTERRVSSGSKVLTSHLQPASPVPGMTPSSVPQRRETRPVTIRAERLDYLDQGHKASYRGNVQLETQNTTLTADRLDVYFSNGTTTEAAGVERAVADGHVKVVQPARHASGEHAEYFAAAGRILMTGGPPALYDAEKGFTTGPRLTFFIHDDRLLVDGGDESPTLSKHRIAR